MSAVSGVGDAAVLARRNLSHIRQTPEKLMDVTIQPLMFVLLFAYVFGGAIHVPGGSYNDYLVGGIMVQTLTFGIFGPSHVALDGSARGDPRPLPLAADRALELPGRAPGLRRRLTRAVDRRDGR